MASRLPRSRVILAALCVTEVTSWGILYYAPAVFILPMERELGWSRGQISLGLSLALATSAVAAVPVGRWLDRRGPRGLMTAGSCAATLLVLAWSQVTSFPAFCLIWAALGLAMAAVLYEPAFATLAAWFVEGRGRALTILTLAGALDSTIFLPLASVLLSALGWRPAVAALAALLAAVTIPLHALVLRRAAPPPTPTVGAGAPAPPREASLTPREATRTLTFRALTTSLVLIAVVNAAVSAHAIPFLVERGHGPGVAALVTGSVGVMQLLGRIGFGLAEGRVAARWLTVSVFALQAVGLARLATAGSVAGLALFVVPYGMGHGMTTLVRAARLADFFGPAHYGAISGVLAFWVTGARALGPVTAGWLYTRIGDYVLVFWLLAAAAVLAAGAAWIAEASAERPGRDDTDDAAGR